jgi:hypothetical protein
VKLQDIKNRNRYVLGFLNFFYNAGIVSSYLFSARSYQQYRMMKLLSSKVVGLAPFVSPGFQPCKHRMSIQGFRHSGNSFLVTQVVSYSPDQIHSHSHRLWAVAQALDHDIVPVVLIRRPQEVLSSTLRRTHSGEYQNLPYTLYRATLLITWYLYYRSLKRYRDKVCLVPFGDLIAPDGYATVRAKIQRCTGIMLCDKQNFVNVNRGPIPHATFRHGPVTMYLVSRCDRLYDKLVTYVSDRTL